MSKLSIGELIKKYRTMKGFTQAELADGLSEMSGKKVMPSAIAGFESGQRIPKVEVRNQIAAILEVDPVVLSGLKLTETDEKRLLLKLLAKYSEGLSLNDDGTVDAKLSADFAGFQMEYEDNRSRMEFNLKGEDAESLEYKLQKRQADDELDYWMDMYPTYDPTTHCKENNKELTVDNMKESRELIDNDLNAEFFKFQDKYLTPQMNKEITEIMRKGKK